jgi:hypothetical protein
MADRKFLVSMPHAAPRTYASIEAVLMHASQHARNRLLHACEAISWIGGLARQWRKRHMPVFSLKGAAVQDATAGSGEQAAHVLPGQILIDGNPPWALAYGDATKVAWLARFMVTSAVPVSFNTADSAAEKAGLKEAFRIACERAWVGVLAGQRDLSSTYEQFLEEADRAFQRAEHAKQGRQASASLKGAARASDERYVESLILRMYRTHGVTAKDATRKFPLKLGT